MYNENVSAVHFNKLSTSDREVPLEVTISHYSLPYLTIATLFFIENCVSLLFSEMVSKTHDKNALALFYNIYESFFFLLYKMFSIKLQLTVMLPFIRILFPSGYNTPEQGPIGKKTINVRYIY